METLYKILALSFVISLKQVNDVVDKQRYHLVYKMVKEYITTRLILGHLIAVTVIEVTITMIQKIHVLNSQLAFN